MAGRGRGRGRGATLSFNLDALGVQRGEIFAAGPAALPPQLFPPLPRMPIPDTNYDPDDLKLLEIRRTMRAKHRQRSACLTLDEKKRDIERYSDKYQLNQQEDQGWTPDWSQFPHELRPDRLRKRKAVTVRPNLKAARTTSVKTADILAKAKERLGVDTVDGVQRDDDEEKNEEEDEEKEGEEGEEEEEEEELDEEEETDYNLTYFDNGEGYGDDDDDDDEPAYS
ncbi:DNA-directed RNA polymerase III subunit RPC7-like [Babylonia areolata]|uniref:DNA-directed RNA polymerase III subunit RPC7-like n=1 Tax=Babylonia areolata TaxID=304850 RepID=UPI003FD5A3FF